MTYFLQLCDGGRLTASRDKPAIECHTAWYCTLREVEYHHGYSRLSGERLASQWMDDCFSGLAT